MNLGTILKLNQTTYSKKNATIGTNRDIEVMMSDQGIEGHGERMRCSKSEKIQQFLRSEPEHYRYQHILQANCNHTFCKQTAIIKDV